MRVAFVAPQDVVITDENFADYLGNDQYVPMWMIRCRVKTDLRPSYYNAYIQYFHRIVLEPGATISNILEKYLFSEHYNIRRSIQGAQQPEMLNRFLEILLHPIIHVGYGAEFGIPGMIVEGVVSSSVRSRRLNLMVFKVWHGLPCTQQGQLH